MCVCIYIYMPTRFLYIYMYIYIYASGLLSGPDYGFYELISGPGRVNKRAGSFETACFIVRNGVTGFRGKSTMTRKSRNRPFRKMGIFEAFCCAFFWPPFLEALFSRLWSSLFWQHSCRGGHTRNATKQGVSERCCGFLHLQALWACRHGKI